MQHEDALRAIRDIVADLEGLERGHPTLPYDARVMRLHAIAEGLDDLVTGGKLHPDVETRLAQAHLRLHPSPAALMDIQESLATLRVAESMLAAAVLERSSPLLTPLSVTVDPGSASPAEVADILSDLSILYRRMRGSGIDFSPQGVEIFAEAER